MSVEAHLSQLNTKHRDLDAQIHQEMKAPQPDALRLSTLKRRKLQIKDRIHELSDAGSFSG